MGQFHDYDAWGDAISGASLRLACDAVETRVWSLDTAARSATVTDVLSLHGIWDFGRFAARYRRQFGELPSETVRRVRA